MLWEIELDSYGRVKIPKGEEGFCPFAYQGQIIDKETGLYYNRFRYYSPEEGMYISQDPIKLRGGHNFYGYIHDPNTWIDPLGLAGAKTITLTLPNGNEYKAESGKSGGRRSGNTSHSSGANIELTSGLTPW